MLTLFLRLTSSPALVARFNRWAPLLVIAIATLLRLYDLNYPKTLVFDETYYVKDAYSLIHNGYEGSWSANADQSFAQGDPQGLNDQPSFVVHPPLGKWLIALGMLIFGAGNPFGWRIVVALFGVGAVWLTMACAKLIFKSTIWSVVAGLLFAIDGVAVVLSRTALLDQVLGFFVLLGFYFFLRDRESFKFDSWRRPWLIAMAVALGLATAVKWSGLYFIIVLVVFIVLSEVRTYFLVHRNIERLAGTVITPIRWVVPALEQTLRTVCLVFFPAVFSYLASWSGWFFTKGGWDRGWAEVHGNALTGWLSFIPKELQSLWHYHQEIYSFHVNLHASHPYASSAWTWPFMLRPTSFFWADKSGGQIVSAVTALGNPIIWWAAILAAGVLLASWFRTRDRTTTIICLGLIAGYVPWLLLTNRTVFEFYAVAFEPWLILLLVFGLRTWFRNSENRGKTANLLLGFVLLTISVSIFFYPIWTGQWLSYEFWHWRMWLPSWI